MRLEDPRTISLKFRNQILTTFYVWQHVVYKGMTMRKQKTDNVNALLLRNSSNMEGSNNSRHGYAVLRHTT